MAEKATTNGPLPWRNGLLDLLRTMTNAALALLFRQEDGELALRALFERHKGHLVRRCLSKVPLDDRKDLLQDIYLKLLANRHKFRDGFDWIPWAMRVSRNVVNDYWRKQNRFPKTTLEADHANQIPATQADVEQLLIDAELSEGFRACLDRDAGLTPDERSLIIAVDLGGRRAGEVARTLGHSDAWASTTRCSAWQKLRRCLERKGLGENHANET